MTCSNLPGICCSSHCSQCVFTILIVSSTNKSMDHLDHLDYHLYKTKNITEANTSLHITSHPSTKKPHLSLNNCSHLSLLTLLLGRRRRQSTTGGFERHRLARVWRATRRDSSPMVASVTVAARKGMSSIIHPSKWTTCQWRCPVSEHVHITNCTTHEKDVWCVSKLNSWATFETDAWQVHIHGQPIFLCFYKDSIRTCWYTQLAIYEWVTFQENSLLIRSVCIKPDFPNDTLLYKSSYTSYKQKSQP